MIIVYIWLYIKYKKENKGYIRVYFLIFNILILIPVTLGNHSCLFKTKELMVIFSSSMYYSGHFDKKQN